MYVDGPIHVGLSPAGASTITLDATAPMTPRDALALSEKLRAIACIALAMQAHPTVRIFATVLAHHQHTR